jgi:hypothetical protein
MSGQIQTLKRKLHETRLRAAAASSEDVKSALLSVAHDFELDIRALEAKLANDKKTSDTDSE